MMRTYSDTQFFKECSNGLDDISKSEWDEIKSLTKGQYRYYEDDANELVAFSTCESDQRVNPNLGEDIVWRLNAICENEGRETTWFLGDVDEEYVFID